MLTNHSRAIPAALPAGAEEDSSQAAWRNDWRGHARNWRPLAFALGVLAVAFGVAVHLRDFFGMAEMHYRMAGMSMSRLMWWGMAAIVLGTLVCGAALSSGARRASSTRFTPEWPVDAPLTWRHGRLTAVLMVALVIDVMKPASLGFVAPGMVQEYGLHRGAIVWLPIIALGGTVAGSLLWGALGDAFGRRAAVLLAGVIFIGTSICGTMPTFGGNLVMCFLMGLSAGGMMPVAFVLLAETVPNAHRGPLLALVGALAAAGGYFAASGLAFWLEPHFGWRILWLAGLPSGLVLVGLSRAFPESPDFLLRLGEERQAAAIALLYGAKLIDGTERDRPIGINPQPSLLFTAGVMLTAVAWGLVNFGFVLWLPSALRSEGLAAQGSNALLMESAILSLPAAVIAPALYKAIGGRWTLLAMLALTTVALLSLAGLGVPTSAKEPVLIGLFALVLFGQAGTVSVLLPYAVEARPIQSRARYAGAVAAATKLSGFGVQLAVLAAIQPGLSAAGLLMAGAAAGAAVVVLLGRGPGPRRRPGPRGMGLAPIGN